MKTIKSITLILSALILFYSCNSSKSAQLPGITKEFQDSVSYAIGASLGSMVSQVKEFEDLNRKEIHKAIDDVLDGKTLKVDMNVANEIITNYLIKKQEAVNVLNTEKGAKFLEHNKTKAGVVELESGLQYKILSEGNGIKPEPQDTVEVHYKGTLIDGTEFDSSYERGQTATLVLNQFIPGWVEGMQFVSEGGKIELFIPADLAYGAQKAGEKIEPGSTLVFEVELISVKKAKQ